MKMISANLLTFDNVFTVNGPNYTCLIEWSAEMLSFDFGISTSCSSVVEDSLSSKYGFILVYSVFKKNEWISHYVDLWRAIDCLHFNNFLTTIILSCSVLLSLYGTRMYKSFYSTDKNPRISNRPTIMIISYLYVPFEYLNWLLNSCFADEYHKSWFQYPHQMSTIIFHC